MSNDNVTELYDAKGNLVGALLTAKAWNHIKPHVAEALGIQPEGPAEKPEPMGDWEMLLEYWDFQYDPDYDVTCDECGQSTQDWKEDDPRKFRLISCTLGGLVNFRCQECRARVTKKHFKKEIVSETTPYSEKKTFKNEAKHPDRF